MSEYIAIGELPLQVVCDPTLDCGLIVKLQV